MSENISSIEKRSRSFTVEEQQFASSATTRATPEASSEKRKASLDVFSASSPDANVGLNAQQPHHRRSPYGRAFIAFDPPCKHNNFDSRRAKEKNAVLCCRDCKVKWRLPNPLPMLCPEFLRGTCPLGASCPYLHVHRFRSSDRSPNQPGYVVGTERDEKLYRVAQMVLSEKPLGTPASAIFAEVLKVAATVGPDFVPPPMQRLSPLSLSENDSLMVIDSPQSSLSCNATINDDDSLQNSHNTSGFVSEFSASSFQNSHSQGSFAPNPIVTSSPQTVHLVVPQPIVAADVKVEVTAEEDVDAEAQHTQDSRNNPTPARSHLFVPTQRRASHRNSVSINSPLQSSSSRQQQSPLMATSSRYVPLQRQHAQATGGAGTWSTSSSPSNP